MYPSRFSFDIEIIRCPVCAEVFKSPRVLHCGHSACLSCLSTLIVTSDSAKTKDSFQCPSCHRNTKPRDPKQPKLKWATQFPVNATLVKLLHNASVGGEKSTRRAFCELCLKNNTTKLAIAYCNTCFEHHCENCAKHHQIAEETLAHQVVTFTPTDEHNSSSYLKSRMDRAKVERRKSTDESSNSTGRGSKTKSDKRVRISQSPPEPKLKPPPILVTQTITASQPNLGNTVVKLGFFNGSSLTDSGTCEFRSITFLTDSRVVLADHANKKIKVFDISHKTRVEILTEMSLRAEPLMLCTVDSNTFAVVTVRSGSYHIRLFTVREKIQHFVQKIVEGTPVGVGFLANTVACSTLQETGLHMYRMSRSQQNKIGTLRQDVNGTELFRQPGVMVSGNVNGYQALYVADESEFGVTVMAIDLQGTKLSSVFLECLEPKSKKPNGAKGMTTLRGVLKSRRFNQLKMSQSLPLPKTDTEQNQTQGSGQEKKWGTVKGPGKAFNAFVSIVDQVRALKNEASKPPDSSVIEDTASATKKEVPLIIRVEQKLKQNGRTTGRLLNRAVGKPTKTMGKTSTSDVSGQKDNDSPRTDSRRSDKVPKPKIYRADSIAVDNGGYVYICMCKDNKIHQLSPDGRIRRDMLSEADGLVSPKSLSFSPSNDIFLVSCANTNRVMMFRMKKSNDVLAQ